MAPEACQVLFLFFPLAFPGGFAGFDQDFAIS
jgi:hypothetical protein